MQLKGSVRDKDGNPIAGVAVEVKNKHFETVYEARSDEEGLFCADIPDGTYPYVTAVRDYADKYLEYWCQDIGLSRDRELDIRIGRLEVYGLHVFRVRGAYPSAMIYFRPMSLEKFKNGETDICPDVQTVRVRINGLEVPVYITNRTLEYCGDRTMGAYLIQTGLPSGIGWDSLERVDVEIRDTGGDFGSATLFV